MSKTAKITCPHCQKPSTWSTGNPYRPFCCKRCQLLDLGDWAAENHRIAGASMACQESGHSLVKQPWRL
jgi:endogenous inhibitor of DNA gyrase (YacG/DUF329 family)